MKRIIIGFVCLFGFIGSTTAQELKSNTDVANSWRNQVIAVKGGGQAPDVMTLLQAFHKQLPTWVTGEVLKRAKNLKDGEQYESEEDYRVLVNRRNGYVDLASGTDIDQMQACVWKRKNGHRIFAISLYEQHDPVTNLLCWYDYDPQTETLKPDRSPLDDFQIQFPSAQIGWNLPMIGTSFEIMEYHPFIPTLTHVFSWDGMKHHEDKILLEDFEYQCFGEDERLRASEQGYQSYALTDLTNEGYPTLYLRKAPASETGETEYALFSMFKGDMQMVGCDGMEYRLNGIFVPQPEPDAPWTLQNAVVFTDDFLHNHYFSVITGGLTQYLVVEEPWEDDMQQGYEARIIGYGSPHETIHIINASVAKEIVPTLCWHDLEFTEEAP